MTSDTIPNIPGPEIANRQRAHVAYLDGLRGLAALWVVLYHFVGFGIPYVTSPVLRALLGWTVYGNLAVAIFIVLSGYLLQRQLNGDQLKGGLRGFAKRRFVRIVPTYLAALLLAIAGLALSTHGLHNTADLSVNSIVSHVLLLHNLFPAYVKSISGPFWSVATEWDIYIVFALVLVPICRRYGIVVAVLMAFVLGFAPLCLLPPTYNLSWASPWFIGLFGLGMAGSAYHKCHEKPMRLQKSLVVTATVLLLMEILVLMSRRAVMMWLPDLLTGAVTIAVIIHCGEMLRKSRNSILLRLTSSHLSVWLAGFSYSLYLTHATFVLKLHPIIEHFHPSPEMRCWIGLVVETPIAVFCAWCFYLLVERHCIRWQSTISR